MRANLYTLLKADEKQVRKIIKKILKENGYKVVAREDFIYAEGTVPVLLVGHYDTVAESPRYIKNDDGVLSGMMNGRPHQLGADDRAGIYAILETIRNHHCHVLFTGGEERGGIGAEAFTRSEIKPAVNYVLQFDRKGSNDAVYYWAENEDFEKFIADRGWKKAEGTYTDIVDLCPYLGVMGVNLSIGYKNEHTTSETLDTDVMNLNIKRIPALLDGERFEYKESTKYSNWFRGVYSGGYYNDYDDDYVNWWRMEDEKNSSSKDTYYTVVYEDEDGTLFYEELKADSYFAAIGYFLYTFSFLTYESIVEIVKGRLSDEDKQELVGYVH